MAEARRYGLGTGNGKGEAERGGGRNPPSAFVSAPASALAPAPVPVPAPAPAPTSVFKRDAPISNAGSKLHEWLRDALVQGLLAKAKEEQEEHERRPNRLWPSGIGRCLRAQYYSYFFPEEFDANRLSIFATGKAIHLYIPEILRAGGVQVKGVECKVSLRHPSREIYIDGRVDIILVNDGEEDVVVEVKSARRLPREPHRQHILQLQCYLNYLKLKRGLILYWDKSAGNIAAYEVAADPGVMEEVWRRCEAVCDCIARQEPPEREGAENEWECLFCEHFFRCHIGEVNKPLAVWLESGIYGGVPIWKGDGQDLDPHPPRPDQKIVERMSRALLEERDVVVLTEADESRRKAAESLLVYSGIPFTVVLARPWRYDPCRWKEKVMTELKKCGAELLP